MKQGDIIFYDMPGWEWFGIMLPNHFADHNVYYCKILKTVGIYHDNERYSKIGNIIKINLDSHSIKNYKVVNKQTAEIIRLLYL